jgi:predicted nucleotidyltransferase
MKQIEEIKNRLAGLKTVLREKYGVTEIGVFGSYVRREQSEKSDLDILVDYAGDLDLLEIVGVENYLSDRLHQKVDLIPKRCLRPELKDIILNEVVTI